MASSFSRRHTPRRTRKDEVDVVEESAGDVAGKFSRTARSFEIQAAALARGFHVALFVQRFKKGLLKVRERT